MDFSGVKKGQGSLGLIISRLLHASLRTAWRACALHLLSPSLRSQLSQFSWPTLTIKNFSSSQCGTYLPSAYSLQRWLLYRFGIASAWKTSEWQWSRTRPRTTWRRHRMRTTWPTRQCQSFLTWAGCRRQRMSRIVRISSRGTFGSGWSRSMRPFFASASSCFCPTGALCTGRAISSSTREQTRKYSIIF